jgi:hypothetical protein
VPFGDLPAYARAADVCVQLPYPARGETSAALLRELAAGAACIVFDQGSKAELPGGAVLKVRSPDHEVEDLTAALARLHDDPAARAALSQGALRSMREAHGMADAWMRYAAMIELTAARRAAADQPWAEHAADALAAFAAGGLGRRDRHLGRPAVPRATASEGRCPPGAACPGGGDAAERLEPLLDGCGESPGLSRPPGRRGQAPPLATSIRVAL